MLNKSEKRESNETGELYEEADLPSTPAHMMWMVGWGPVDEFLNL